MRFFTSPAIYAYIAVILAVNIGFSYVPMISTPLGLISPMAVVVGFAFVIRDFAQRAVGHSVLGAMAIGVVLSYVLADPYVATASAFAFAASELADYLIYTISGKPFYKRVLISSAVSTPIDTAVFLFGISGFTIGTFCLMVISKMIAAVVIYHFRPTRDTEFVGENIEAPYPHL